MRSTWSRSGYGAGLSVYALRRLNIDALAPMPSPSVTIATSTKPGVRIKDWIAKRRSFMESAPARSVAPIGPAARATPIAKQAKGLAGLPAATERRSCAALTPGRPITGHPRRRREEMKRAADRAALVDDEVGSGGW